MTEHFAHERRYSQLFGTMRIPVARISFQSPKSKRWYEVTMLVDTGADFTLLPRWYADALEIDLERDCEPVIMSGIGGQEAVFLFRGIIAKLGLWRREIPVGFLATDDVLPLMGRQAFFETFRVVFENYVTTFYSSRNKSRRAR